jgi:hypothetical protein
VTTCCGTLRCLATLSCSGSRRRVLTAAIDAIVGPCVGCQAAGSDGVGVAAPAGTLVAHGIDTFHRGTNLTLEGAHRYTMTVGYKARGNDQIGFHVWQSSAERDWGPILAAGSPEQLAMLGIPRPGDPFWTPRALALTQARWPMWDMQAWVEGAPVG